MSAATGVAGPGRESRVPWADVVMSAVAAVSWALIGMAGTAALGLHLLDADSAGSLAPMAAAVVALAVGGSVTPTGDVSVLGLSGAEAETALDVVPLGVGLVGAVLLSLIFLRSLRTAGVVVSGRELAARAGAVVALSVATAGGLAWAGHDVITVDVAALGVDGLPGTGGGGGDGGGGGLDVPGLGDIGELLPDQVGDLVGADVTVGFTVDTVPTLLAGLGWSAGVLLVALLASRRTPLPRGWDALHRVVRPAVSSVVAVLLVAVAAGIAAAAYAALGDAHPRRIAGAALLGAPDGVWLGLSVGLLVPWDAQGDGALLGALPHPLDDLLRAGTEEPVTLARLAELDGRVWLLGVGAATAMLLAGVLTGVRTPVGGAAPGSVGAGGSAGGASARGSARRRPVGAGGFAGRCAVALGAATAVTLPLLVWLTEVSVGASLSVLGYDAFDAGLDLRGRLGAAVLLGALWGAGAGAAGALPAWACGAAGTRAAVLARGAGDVAGSVRPPSGPYTPGTPHRPPNPDTNPYLRLPGTRPERGAPEDAVPGRATPGPGDGADDVSAAPTVISPTPPPRPPRPDRRRLWPDRVPPPPPPPPAPPGSSGPRDPQGGRNREGDGRGPGGR
ncbi:streptophobe family protein [Streptomyces lusitanus]|uniref:Streptophobe family protein n=1 Tax=Streptomyces lusitanus TaxID=68232 RepID=A0ABU3K1G9_9ACTN|nr:streptophobe family protein [Streptomyces lusitanus]